MNESTYKCPLCQQPLKIQRGHSIDPLDGITIFCDNKECGMKDWGHGKNEKEAFEVYNQKCGKA